jgi:hypothetical protein
MVNPHSHSGESTNVKKSHDECWMNNLGEAESGDINSEGK